MSISSSLSASVSGLFAQSSRLAGIADNIANSATHGYKRIESEFNSFVVNKNFSTGLYTAGGVRNSSFRIIDQQGPLTQTDHPLDIAISGRGMLPVVPLNALDQPEGDRPFLMTTTGSFRLDKDGILRTQSGHVLQGWPANADGSFNTPVRDSVTDLAPIIINSAQAVADPTTRVNLALNLPATETAFDASGDSIPISVEYFDNLGAGEKLHLEFKPSVGHASGKSNEWTLTIRDSATPDDPATATDESIIGEYIITFDDNMGTGGSIASVTPTSGQPYDATEGVIALDVAGGTIDLHLGEPGAANALTQVGSRLQQAVEKNGSPAGALTGLTIDEMGILHGVYDTGITRPLYKVPLVNVPNINGLNALPDQTYQVTANSGSFFLWDAGEGPTGSIIGHALEESATDIAAELTQLIQTQRAYSSNAKVVQTVDEMLQETANLKR